MTAEDHLRRVEQRATRQEQDLELYKAIAQEGAKTPDVSRVSDVLATEEGRRIVRKWELKYGRKAPPMGDL